MTFRINKKKIALDRAKQGLSLNELSNKSQVGRSTISRIERGEVKPRLDTVGRIALALGAQLEDYLIDKDTGLVKG